MPHVITQNCCNDSACVDVCPVNCIHPAPGEEGFATAELLYIDPQVCIDCGACVSACPVNAIYRESQLPPDMGRYIEINAAYADGARSVMASAGSVGWPTASVQSGTRLTVAIVGSGPSGAYAATHLLQESGAAVEVTMVDQLATPWGLVRSGVAPDHPETKSIVASFERLAMRPEFHLHLNVRVGEDVTSEELLDHHHAVIYAVGAGETRPLGVPGESLAGSHPASDFVRWYNGHPDAADLTFDLSAKRVVIIGNGNVALDIARMLVLDPDELARTDIAEHALHALRDSSVEEVVVLGRRGPAQAAYTSPELLALGSLNGVDVVVDPIDVQLDPVGRDHLAAGSVSARLKHQIAAEFAHRGIAGESKRIVLRFLSSPTAILGDQRVEAVRVAHNQVNYSEGGAPHFGPTGLTQEIQTHLVLRANGFRGEPTPGVPYDEASGTILNDAGRVIDPETGSPLRGLYTAGWIKRGPSGVIGTNRACSLETIRALRDDYANGLLGDPVGSATGFSDLVSSRHPQAISYRDWQRIDSHERELGARHGRPRVKITATDDLLNIARTRTTR